ncbi:MAG: porin family protein [Bradyrhizobium sp.]|nr:porin family protein [Bradyrhizobium sp.]
MKRAILAGWIAASAGMTQGLAADLRLPSTTPQRQPSAAIAASWAGPYIGAHAGYLTGGGETTFPGSAEFHLIDPAGLAGGVVAGAAMQWGRIVGGGEADLGFVAAKSTVDTGLPPDPTVTQLQSAINWNSHLRGRLGYGLDSALFYVAGGLALAGVENKSFDNGAGVSATWNDTRVGWTLGGGVEYRIAPRAAVRLEYLYDNYGSKTLAAQTFGFTTFSQREHKLDTHTLRAGVNWRF